MFEEVWKPVEDFLGIYEVSNLDNVRSLDVHFATISCINTGKSWR